VLSFSKTLTTVNSTIVSLLGSGKFLGNKDIINIPSSNLPLNTLKLRNYSCNTGTNSLTCGEAFYQNIQYNNLLQVRNISLDINFLNKFFKKTRNTTLFNFNLENNLNISKQYRWLTKNSLLNESIINNSYLLTQSKKLIGLGIFDKDFSNKNL
jgi:hypothetical protein